MEYSHDETATHHLLDGGPFGPALGRNLVGGQMNRADEFEAAPDGVLVRKHRADRSALWNGRYAGKPAGSIRADGYVRVRTAVGKVYAHRIVYEMFVGPIPPGYDVDHKNMDRADNRPENLRLATRAENKANGKRYATNSSGAKGVNVTRSGKFQVSVGGSAGRRYVGQYSSLGEAIAAYESAAKARYGNFSRSDTK